ncbi:MAG: 50S ribosomal protein L19e [Candidatus Bilamarchaeum sp.]|jgi:large subunit ribosomal protein L19e
MTLQTVRRLAADILHVGENKIRLVPEMLSEAQGALTREDVRNLIKKGAVKKVPNAGRASASKRDRRSTGRTRGARVSVKEMWMQKIRAQRKFLKVLVADKALPKEQKRAVYFKIKSGIFKNKRAMLLYLKDNKLVSESYEPKKVVPVQVTKSAPKPKAEVPKVAQSAPAAKPKPVAEKKEPQTKKKGENK